MANERPWRVRCKRCRAEDVDHVNGKCLYGPDYYEPWHCDSPHCPHTGHLFQMEHVIACVDGQFYHRSCIARLRGLPTEKAILPGEQLLYAR